MQQTCKMVSDATVLPPNLLLSFFFKLGGASRLGPERSKCLATLRVLHRRAVKKVSHFRNRNRFEAAGTRAPRCRAPSSSNYLTFSGGQTSGLKLEAARWVYNITHVCERVGIRPAGRVCVVSSSQLTVRKSDYADSTQMNGSHPVVEY